MDVEQRLREFHAQAAPDPLAVEALLQATVGSAKEKESTSFNQRVASVKQSWAFYLTAVSAACLVFALVGFSFHEQGSLNERTERTVREVAMNHITHLKSEHESSSIVELDLVMQQLPFALKLPEHLRNNFTVAGSRYCSLAGHLAAHIKLRNIHDGKLSSLFVALLENDLKSIGLKSQKVAGVDVELFNEDGLFYALASR